MSVVPEPEDVSQEAPRSPEPHPEVQSESTGPQLAVGVSAGEGLVEVGPPEWDLQVQEVPDEVMVVPEVAPGMQEVLPVVAAEEIIEVPSDSTVGQGVPQPEEIPGVQGEVESPVAANLPLPSSSRKRKYMFDAPEDDDLLDEFGTDVLKRARVAEAMSQFTEDVASEAQAEEVSGPERIPEAVPMEVDPAPENLCREVVPFLPLSAEGLPQVADSLPQPPVPEEKEIAPEGEEGVPVPHLPEAGDAPANASPLRPDPAGGEASSSRLDEASKKAALLDMMLAMASKEGWMASSAETDAMQEKITSLRSSVEVLRREFLSFISSMDGIVEQGQKEFESLRSDFDKLHEDYKDLLSRYQFATKEILDQARDLQAVIHSLEEQDNAMNLLEETLWQKDQDLKEAEAELFTYLAQKDKAVPTDLWGCSSTTPTVQGRLDEAEAQLAAERQKVADLQRQLKAQEEKLKAGAQATRAFQKDERDRLYNLFMRRFRLAAFHALPDFEWAPVRAKLGSRLSPHPKESEVRREEEKEMERATNPPNP